MRGRVLATVMLAMAVLAGCSSGRPRIPTSLNDVGENLGFRGEVPAFAAVDNLSVRDGARVSARVVGHLDLHQMVLRSGVNNGYARVRVPYGSLRGWVDDDKLLEKLPSDG